MKQALSDLLRSFWSRRKELLGQSLIKNILSLYSVHFAYYLLPLITVPYLTRVLGAAGWGYVAFTQGFTGAITILVEYGFNFSATREASRFRHDPRKRSEILAGVLGAKLFLSVVAATLTLALVPWIAIFREQPLLLMAGLAWSISQAFSLSWYFSGLEQMRFVATMEVATRLMATIGLFWIVKNPEDAWKTLAVQAVASLISLLAGLTVAYREVPITRPRLSSVIDGLKVGRSMFLFRSAESIYNVGASFLLGLWAPPQYVAYYAGAERLSKAAYGVLEPISRALYPRLSFLVQHSREEAYRTIRVAMVVMVSGGLIIGGALFVAAPYVVKLMLGPQFQPAVTALRILSILPVLIAIKNVIGFHWMLPFGLDGPFNRIIITSGVVHLAFVLLIGRHFAHVGMAWSLAIAEFYVVSAIYIQLRRRGLDPWRRQTPARVSKPESSSEVSAATLQTSSAD